MSYNIKLSNFEGPLDLLLFFIKRDEINIYDIPIAHITREYLEYLNLMQSLNLHIAGEFILMASMLMRIKVQMLLPRTETENLNEIEDPRTELVQMLVEYQKYRDLSHEFGRLEEEQRQFYPVNGQVLTQNFDPDLFLADVNLFDLALAFQKVLEAHPERKTMGIETIKINLSEQIQYLRHLFEKRGRIKFIEVVRQLRDRIEVVVTFLALLELIRTAEVRVSQKTVFGDIWLTKTKHGYEYPIPNA